MCLSTQAVAGAFADTSLRTLDPKDCLDRPVVSESQIGNAWHLDRLRMPEVWRIATGKGIKVAVIDTGVSTGGSVYLEPTRVRSYDLMPPSEDETSGFDCDHGTQVTAILGASLGERGEPHHQATNFAGIAPDAEIYAYRTLGQSLGADENKGAPLAPAIAAINQAIAEKVDVINFSQVVEAGTIGFPEFKRAIEDALAAGIVVVAAAGNTVQRAEGFTGAAFPAGFPDVIAVGSSNEFDAGDQSTMTNRKIDLGAPGVGIVSLNPSPARAQASVANQAFATNLVGTSFATPIVSGVVALMLQSDRDMARLEPGYSDANYKKPSPQEIRARLMVTADPPPSTLPDRFIGAGIVNPMRALRGTFRDPVNPSARASVPETPFPEPVKPDQTPVQVGLGMAVGATVVVLFGLGAAIAIPAATRRR